MDCGVARCRDRRHVIEIGVGEERSIAYESAKSIVAIQIPETIYEVIAELVNHNHYCKLRARPCARLRLSLSKPGCGKRTQQQANKRYERSERPKSVFVHKGFPFGLSRQKT